MKEATLRNLLKWASLPALGLALAAPFGAVAAEPTIVELTQVACQFVESENGTDHKYKTGQKADCEAINAKTGADRLAKATPLKLKPGKYIFRVTNKNVPYSLGFWVRDKDYDWRNPLHKLSKTSVSGGGMALGKTLEYEVELKPGEYVYSCPLNTTPDYTLIVEG
jgi:hypothetical protein